MTAFNYNKITLSVVFVIKDIKFYSFDVNELNCIKMLLWKRIKLQIVTNYLELTVLVFRVVFVVQYGDEQKLPKMFTFFFFVRR